MRPARCCPAEGQGRLTAFSSVVHRGLGRRRPLPRGVWTVPAGCLPPAKTVPTAFSSRGFVAHARRRSQVENLMRSLPLLLIGFAGIALAAPVAGQRSDDQIAPKSVELQRQAKDLTGAARSRQPKNLLERPPPSIRATGARSL